ncbi:hypothetical protein SAMN05421736_111128 [Evansella caseinilytica]|uniref:Uncharacterized protein n=1 Tax=Evansella caseinilytica TaxID=1503961 RepID=A0A1H3SNF1_9BACI|nr:hypothetical protein SAMN05421736_111128 [Evansella caseinilytica]
MLPASRLLLNGATPSSEKGALFNMVQLKKILTAKYLFLFLAGVLIYFLITALVKAL